VKTVISVTTDRQHGGIATALMGYSRALRRAGYRHLVLLPNTAPIIDDLRAEPDTKLCPLPIFTLKFHLASRFIFWPAMRATITDATAVMVHNASLIRPIASLHSTHILVNHSGKTRYLEQANSVIFLSQSAHKRGEHYFDVKNLPPANRPKSYILPHGFSTHTKNRKKRAIGQPPRLIAAGRFVQKKGFSDLIEAAAILQAKNIPCSFELYGAGPLADSYARDISRLKLTNFTLKGWADDLPALFAASDIFCLPSHEEPFGLILGEAMQEKLAVIASKTDGPSDILGQNGHTPEQTLKFGGLLYDTGDISGLADAICMMISDPKQCQNTGDAAARHIQTEYNLDKHSQKLADILLSL